LKKIFLAIAGVVANVVKGEPVVVGTVATTVSLWVVTTFGLSASYQAVLQGLILAGAAAFVRQFVTPVGGGYNQLIQQLLHPVYVTNTAASVLLKDPNAVVAQGPVVFSDPVVPAPESSVPETPTETPVTPTGDPAEGHGVTGV